MNEDSIFLEALQHDSAEARGAFLDQACTDNAQLRLSVEQLLRAHERADDVLGPKAEGLPVTASPCVTERIGTQVGPYKLLQQIGEGGMGVVFMAEQMEPIQRTVALKIIKPGMDSRQVIARFDAERQALALMDHPNIAKVLDAGTTDSGRPYFVMELVKGIPITKYCDEKQLPLRERLELFLPVCHAVQHAHQKGIIHRDIKPTNVLVAEYDNHAVPKVIDFGVAKATAQKLTERTMFTEFGQIVGTVEYMSPEQAKLNQLDIDTRSDIYSLGVLLYELLTGSTPFEQKRLREVAFDEVLRIIREEEPPKPSTKLSSSDTLPSIAANRHTEPARLTKEVHGELDWIVMKSIDKDRNRRYETADGLARDVGRYLVDEPVQACPPSAVYRLRKFARRNKAALIVLSTIVSSLILLVVGLAYSNRMITVERNQKAEALAQTEVERQRAQDNFLRARMAVRDIVTRPAMGLDEWRQLPPPLRNRFSEEAVKFYDSLIQQNSSNPSLQYEAAVGYNSIGTLHVTAGEPREAEKSFQQSMQIMDRLVARYPDNRLYRGHLAWSCYNLGSVLFRQNQSPEAQSRLEQAAELYEKLLRDKPNETDFRNQLALCYRKLSEISMQAGDNARASELLRREIPILAALTDEKVADGSRDCRLAQANALLGQVKAASGEVTEAHKLIQRAIEQYRRMSADSPNDVVRRRRVAEGYGKVAAYCAITPGFAKEAETAFRRLMKIYDEHLAEFTAVPAWNVTTDYLFFAYFLATTQRQEESAEFVSKAARNVQRLTDPNALANDLYLLAVAQLRLGDKTGYRATCKALVDLPFDKLEVRKKSRPIGTPCLAPGALDDLSLQVTRAEEYLANIPQSKRHFGLYLLGAAHFRAGQYEQAAKRLEESIAAFPSGSAPVTDSINYHRLFLAMTKWQLGQRDEARRLLAETLPDVERERQSPASGWNRRATLELLREEAKALIEPKKANEAVENKSTSDECRMATNN